MSSPSKRNAGSIGRTALGAFLLLALMWELCLPFGDHVNLIAQGKTLMGISLAPAAVFVILREVSAFDRMSRFRRAMGVAFAVAVVLVTMLFLLVMS